MSYLLYISDSLIPILLLLIVSYGLYRRLDIYQIFLDGVKKGFSTVFEIAPTLVGLMIAVGILRGSGLLDACTDLICKISWIPSSITTLLPLIFVKLFSSSAATGLLLDIYQRFGTDSFTGFAASLMLCSTETIFYTMSIYFLHVKIRKTRYTLAGALLATLTAVICSIFLANLF